MVTLVILAVMAPPLLGFLLLGADSLARARMETVAVYLAREALDEVRAGGYCAAAGAAEEEVDGFAGYWRRVDVTPRHDTGVGPLKDVRVRVRWETGGRRQEVELVTWMTWR